MRYFSTFSGVGGFEIGIQNAWGSYVQTLGRGETLKTGIDEERSGLYSVPSERTISKDGQLDEHNNRGSNEGQPYCVGYSEIDKYSTKVYEYNFKGTKNYGDITKINADELPDFDCLVGGFPCQAFSIAGKRAGFDDTRGTLFFDLARILRAKQPRLFVFENVKGLLSHDGGKSFKTIIQTIDELGYDCQWQVLNSKNYGVPQNRERIIIVGHLRGTPRPEVFPIGCSDGEDTRIVGQDVAYAIDANYAKGTNTLSKLRRSIVQVNNPVHSNNRVYRDDGISPALNTMQGGNRQPKIVAQRGRYMEDGSTEQQLEPRKDNLSNTLTAVQKDNMVIDDIKIRKLTPIECERLQGFPDDWTKYGFDEKVSQIDKSRVKIDISNSQRYKMMGNAVTTNVIQAVFERIFESVEKENKQ